MIYMKTAALSLFFLTALLFPLYVQTGDDWEAAIKTGDENRVSSLAAQSSDINACLYDYSRETPLSFAAAAGTPGMITILLEAGADPSLLSEEGTPFHCAQSRAIEAAFAQQIKSVFLRAASEGNVPLLEGLLKRGASIGETDRAGMNALMWAAWSGEADAVRLLLEAGADANTLDKSQYNALYFAVKGGFADIARLLAPLTADVDATFMRGDGGSSAMLRAAAAGRRDLVEILRDAGADMTKSYVVGYNALKAAIDNGHPDLIPLFAPYYTAQGDNEILDWALRRDRAAENVARLLEEGIPVFSKNGEHFFFETRLTPEVRALLIKKLDEPLPAAIEAGDEARVTAWIRKNGVNTPDGHGFLPLAWTVVCGKPAMLRVLIREGANIDAPLNIYFAQTALPLAIWLHNTAMVQALLQAGADISIKSKNGYSALFTAFHQDAYDIADLLLKAGADVNESNLPYWLLIWERYPQLQKILPLVRTTFTPAATYLTADSLRLRDKPGTKSATLAVLPVETTVTLLETGEKAEIDGLKSHWVRVSTKDGKTGWCFGGYLVQEPQD